MGNSFTLKSSAFGATAAPSISGFSATPYSATANGKLSVQINGDTYSVALSTSTLTGNVVLTDASNSNSTFTIALGSTSVNVNSQDGIDSLTSTLNSVFGGGLSWWIELPSWCCF